MLTIIQINLSLSVFLKIVFRNFPHILLWPTYIYILSRQQYNQVTGMERKAGVWFGAEPLAKETPSIIQKDALLLKGQLQMLVDESTVIKPANRGEKKNLIHRISSRNIQPQQVLPTTPHLAESMMGAHSNQITSFPQLTDGWQVRAGWLEAACHPNSQRWLSLAGLKKGSDDCFLRWTIKGCQLAV